jgi:hypothetical protein
MESRTTGAGPARYPYCIVPLEQPCSDSGDFDKWKNIAADDSTVSPRIFAERYGEIHGRCS